MGADMKTCGHLATSGYPWGQDVCPESTRNVLSWAPASHLQESRPTSLTIGTSPEASEM